MCVCAVRLLGKICVYFVFSFITIFQKFHLRYKRYTAKWIYLSKTTFSS